MFRCYYQKKIRFYFLQNWYNFFTHEVHMRITIQMYLYTIRTNASEERREGGELFSKTSRRKTRLFFILFTKSEDKEGIFVVKNTYILDFRALEGKHLML